jgi:precorrin-2 methylase
VASQDPIPFAIALIGMGVRQVTHMTLEAITVLRRCRRGFVAGPDQEAVNRLREELATHLKPGDILPPLVSLSSAYLPDRPRCQNYVEAAGLVLQAAQAERPVAYLTFGNPVTYDTVTQEILASARAGNVPTVVIAGVSSVDTVLSDLGQEAGPGLQVFDVSCFVGAEVKPDTRFACLLMQVGVFGTNYPLTGREPRANALAPLKDYLLRLYPPGHPAVLVRSSTHPEEPVNILRVTVGSLDQVPASAPQGVSLYLPALSNPQLGDKFRERLESLDHLKATYPKASG